METLGSLRKAWLGAGNRRSPVLQTEADPGASAPGGTRCPGRTGCRVWLVRCRCTSPSHGRGSGPSMQPSVASCPGGLVAVWQGLPSWRDQRCPRSLKLRAHFRLKAGLRHVSVNQWHGKEVHHCDWRNEQRREEQGKGIVTGKTGGDGFAVDERPGSYGARFSEALSFGLRDPQSWQVRTCRKSRNNPG
jgi:hypothetical protein